jgi:DNA repair exonuclease SbcCD ATPase subunit
MIIIKEMRWSNVFSYGPKNTIRFDKNPITQLVGKNGHGKSSVALILEEILFNKNSKGIKKADIINRYTKDKQYSIELDFDKDHDSYTIKAIRGNTQQVKLYKNGEDISSHTATSTYKTLEELIGLDHKAFSQIVYQSHASSLEFLTATDTIRKKFLIDLLDLGKYSQAAEVFKEVAAELNKDIAAAEAKVSTVSGWLNKYTNTKLELKDLVEVPDLDPKLEQQVHITQQQLSTLDATNKRINQNNTYKQLQSRIRLDPVPDKPNTDVTSLNKQVAVIQKTVLDAKQFVKKMQSLHGSCPTCLSQIDNNKVSQLIAEKQEIVFSGENAVNNLSNTIAQAELELDCWQQGTKAQQEWERYHTLIDKTLETEILDKTQLEKDLTKLKASLDAVKQQVQRAQEHNKQAEVHNAKVEAISRQLLEFTEELETHTEMLESLTSRMATISILAKTFSTNGLVAYKIESLVKDLEELTNNYLVDLSDGRFQISFEVNTRDKLNVVITDNGKTIDILALSGGELARVNAATLLAIRKLMQSLSKTRINLLILDETVEALDVDGKERLIETLLKEESLNTFLVSHGFTHPLLEKVYVIKNNNVSYIED